VLCRLRERYPETRVHAILPRPEATPSIDFDDFAIRRSRSVWNSWIQALPTDNWIELSSPRWIGLGRFAARAARRIQRRMGTSAPADRELRARKLAQTFLSRFGRSFTEGVSTVLCDLADLRHPELGALVRLFANAGIFCQAHGVDIRALPETTLDVCNKRKTVSTYTQGRKITALLLAESERDYYRESYGLDDSQIMICGVLRHDPDWLKSLSEGDFARPPLTKPYVFVASRPISENFLPRETKHKILDLVHDYARQEGLVVAIRKHPVERQRGHTEIEACLGKAGQANGWFDSRCHPLHLGYHADLTVTLYSSIAIDLACLNRSVIEPIDFTNCRAQTPNIRIGEDGKFVSFYQKAGFATRARDREEFFSIADLMRHGKRKKPQPRAVYDHYYANPEGAVEEITRMIHHGDSNRYGVD